MCGDMEALVTPLSVYPLKKRRGRPPKYLNVWRQQFLSNRAQREASSQRGQTPVNLDAPPTLSPEIPKLEPEVPPGEREQESLSLNGDIQGHCNAALRDLPPSLSPVTLETPTTFSHAQSTVAPTSSDNSLHTGTAPPGTDQLPVHVKRRPGRPPGSTKKVKVTYGTYIKAGPPEDDFSLRKFFEAGGRDYNEYLGWLKQGQGISARAPIPMTSPPPTAAVFPPFYPLAVPGGRVMVPQQGIPPGFRFPVPFPVNMHMAPRSPVVAMTPPTVYRHTPVVIGASSPAPTSASRPTGGVDQTENNLQAGVNGNHGNSCTTHPTDQRLPGKQQEQESTADRSRSHNPDCTLALDLSYKRRCPDIEEDIQIVSHKKFRYNIVGRKEEEQRPGSADCTGSGERSRLMEAESTEPEVLRSDVVTWGVDQVSDFVASLPECRVYAQAFKEHRIDGATLPHLSDDHLLNHVGMKLGHMIRLKLAIGKLCQRSS